MSGERMNHIDVATGISIILVVLGHLSDYDPQWYYIFKVSLYKFHMSIFLFLSGYIFSFNKIKYASFEKYLKFISSRFNRLFPPFVFMGLLFLFVKNIMGVYSSENRFIDSFIKIFIEPTSGPAIFIWYIYVLFMYYLVYPLLLFLPLVKKYNFILLVIGVFLYSLTGVTGLFELDTLCRYFLFFTFGYLIYNHSDVILHFIRGFGFIILIVFLLLFSLDISNYLTVDRFILSVSAIPSVLYLGVKMEKSEVLQYIGKKSFVIYLWNSVFIFGVTFLMSLLKINIIDKFYFFGFLLFFVGISFPLILRKIVHDYYISILRKIVP